MVVGFHAQGSSVVGFTVVGFHEVSSSVDDSGVTVVVVVVVVVGFVIGLGLVGRLGNDGITGSSVGYVLIS